jgi:A-kinase anchor protein 14
MSWLSRQDFTKESAISQIDSFISNWSRGDEWLYCIDFVAKTDETYFTEYKFRVRWSIPKPNRPIPKASASVYFTFKILKKMPESTSSKVLIKYETNTQESDSADFVFKENNLSRILETKEKLLRGQAF